MLDISSSAAALYDGGWRASDKEQLVIEYQFTEDEVKKICEKLESYENQKEAIVTTNWYALENVDWGLLYKQKMVLITSQAKITDTELDFATEGLINFLDALLDEAEAKCLWDSPETDEEAE